jgi:hypothetical protein
MNWKNVWLLMQVERKSGRLMRQNKMLHFKEGRFYANWGYWVALVLGISVGLIAAYGSNLASGFITTAEINNYALMIFAILPTIVLLYNLFLTLMMQIQKSSVNASTQVSYWLPFTWQEQTLASILATLLGFPIGTILCIISGILVFSAFTGLIIPALVCSLAIIVSALIASATTEVLRVLQVRFTGAVYKSSGRAAIWLRFGGLLVFFIAFYAIYFYVIYGDFNFFQVLAQTQSSLWFIPYIWPGLIVNNLAAGAVTISLSYLVLSFVFFGLLFALSVFLNKRFGLYEPPAITISKSGLYAPKIGFWGRLGYSTTESAILKKDIRAFTRRKELMPIFITPIVMMLVPVMQSVRLSSIPTQAALIFVGIEFLLPACFMAILLGNFIIGEEGSAVWRLCASPISAKSLVKSKYSIILLFSFLILAISSIVGVVLFNPSISLLFASVLEGVFLVFALSSVSLIIGFKGADFTEIPRPKIIRQSWSLISLLACGLAALAVLAPILPNVLLVFLASVYPMTFGVLNLFLAIAISGVISLVICVFFYRLSLRNAKDFLTKME